MSDIDQNTQAARVFYRLVRDFVNSIKPWDVVTYYDTGPDEVLDLIKVSLRVYGRPDEHLCVMAAAGMDTVDEPLGQRRIALPTEAQLRSLKQVAGFESRTDFRESGKPTWSTD